MHVIMNKLLQCLGVALPIAAGAVVYRLVAPDTFTGDGGAILFALGALLFVGMASGLLLRSWLALVIVPAAFAAGILAQATQFANAEAFAGVGGGVYALGLVFVLALLCWVLAIGMGAGLPVGIRAQKRLAAHHRAGRAARLADDARMSGNLVSPASPRERDLMGAQR